MANFELLAKSTSAFKIISEDKRAGKLSHAYLVINEDSENSGEYLKVLAKLICCDDYENGVYGRFSKLIDSNSHPDVLFFPREKQSVTVEDVSNLIEQSYVKPIESEKKVFVINYGESMSATVQNKLLKTLEEPPKNVIILIGAVSEYSLLETIKSRAKKLRIGGFSSELLLSALSGELEETEDIKGLIASSDGTVRGVLNLAKDEELLKAKDLVVSVITEMKSSKDVLFFSNKIALSLVDEAKFITLLSGALLDLLAGLEGKENLVKDRYVYTRVKNCEGFNRGSLIYALEKTIEAEKRRKFNVKGAPLIEWLLFALLEGKYKWQKL